MVSIFLVKLSKRDLHCYVKISVLNWRRSKKEKKSEKEKKSKKKKNPLNE